MWYLFWFVGILLMCGLSTLALVWRVAAEIILHGRYAFWLPGLFGELFIPFPSARQDA